jgi:hypothetical protein
VSEDEEVGSTEDMIISTGSTTSRVQRGLNADLPRVRDRILLNDCLLLKADGGTFSSTRFVVPSEYLSVVHVTDASTTVAYGAEFIEGDKLSAILFLRDLMQEKGIELTSVWTKDKDVATLDTKESTYIHLALYDDPLQIGENLKILLNTFELEGVTLEDVDYIDLRFGDRVYYRLRSGEEG